VRRLFTNWRTGKLVTKGTLLVYKTSKDCQYFYQQEIQDLFHYCLNSERFKLGRIGRYLGGYVGEYVGERKIGEPIRFPHFTEILLLLNLWN